MSKRAVVTGCSRGIGRAVAEMLLAEGWSVCGLSRTDPRLKHRQFTWWRRDIADAGFLLPRPWASLDALVHCAGIRGPYGLLVDVDAAAWLATIDTNLTGTFRVVSAALPLLRRSEDARILLFSGGGAFDPSPGYSAYAVAKAGAVSLMETLAEELAGTGVAVNCVAPGFVATDIHAGTPLEGKSDGGMAMPTVVACVRHLLSPAAQGLSGRTISAAHDDWPHITPDSVPAIMASRMGRRDRIKVQRLAEVARYAQRNGAPAGMAAR